MRAISDHARGEDFGTKGDRGLTATRVPGMAARARVGTGAEPRVRKPLQARKIGPRASPGKISGSECEQANEEVMLARCEVHGRSRGDPLP
jgi:hypothetical protein